MNQKSNGILDIFKSYNKSSHLSKKVFKTLRFNRTHRSRIETIGMRILIKTESLFYKVFKTRARH